MRRPSRLSRLEGQYLSFKSLIGGYRLLCPQAPAFHRKVVLRMLRNHDAVRRLCSADASDPVMFSVFARNNGIVAGTPLLTPQNAPGAGGHKAAEDPETAILCWGTARLHTGLEDCAIDALLEQPEFNRLDVTQLRKFCSACWQIDPAQFDTACRLRGFRNIGEFREIAARHFLFDPMLLARTA